MLNIALVTTLLSLCILDTADSVINIGKIFPGFRGSNLHWIDDNGIFLSSINRTFTVGIFNPSQGTEFYLVIRHQPSSTIIWTANRDSPVSDSDIFAFSADGEATLTSSATGVVWRTGTTKAGVTAMELRETGNLVFLNSTSGVVWQSFDFPTDTLVSGQVFRSGMRLVSQGAARGGTNKNLSSGSYVLQMQQGNLFLLAEFQPVQKYWSLESDSRRTDLIEESPETAVLMSSGWVFYGRSGVPASKFLFPGDPLANSSIVFGTLVSDGSLQFGTPDSTSSTGNLVSLFLIPAGFCDQPSPCGAYSLCSNDKVCACPQALSTLYGASCSPPQTSASNCSASSSPASFYRVGDGLTYFGVKFQSPEHVAGLQDCENLCRSNCFCNSLFFQNSSNSCYIWGQIGSLQSAATQKDSFQLYVKSSTPLAANSNEGKKSNSSWSVPVIAASAVVGVGIFVLAFFLLTRQTKEKSDEAKWSSSDEGDDIEVMVPGLPTRFKFRELQLATHNFENVLGKGGFGSVYEGFLSDGRRIAVKQLEKIGQGKKEFKAEVATIGSIHHVHLMRLRGFCSEGKQRLLVYDFMPNGSLDKFLFKKSKAGTTTSSSATEFLDWKKRFGIAVGTAKGLAYLHEECAVRIIHCDVKPENILLDGNFSPKVSDFGLAKLLSREESQAFTTMRGTRGYLAPEWLTTSAVSIKSDVYSFGMLLLELVGGRRNFDPSTSSSEKCYFPAYAYQRQSEGRVAEVVDEQLSGEADAEELERCVMVAMWCIQEAWNLRPTMGSVVKMLTGSVKIPPLPSTPPTGFRLHLSMLRGEASSLSGVAGDKTTSASEASENLDHAVLSSYVLSGPR